MALCTLDGIPVRLVASVGERGQIAIARAAPPGTPLVLSGDAGTRLQLKVNRCQKVGNEFHIEGRWVSLTRDDKAWLEQQLRRINEGPSGDDRDPTR